MKWSSILGILALLVASLMAALSLLTEKREAENDSGRLRPYRKLSLYILTFFALIIGSWQIWKADQESWDADKKQVKEHEKDQQNISRLNEAVTTLTNVNQTQYERNRDEIHKLQEDVQQFKLAKISEEDRKQIATLETRLREALAPKPKATLDFGFFYPNLNKGEQRKNIYIPAESGVVKIPFTVENISEVNASGISIWVRICEICKFHSEPIGAIKPTNSNEFDRLYIVREIPPGTRLSDIVVEFDVPRNITQAAVAFSYRCPDCVLDESWHTLLVDVGQIPIPRFSTPAPTSKKPIKH